MTETKRSTTVIYTFAAVVGAHSRVSEKMCALQVKLDPLAGRVFSLAKLQAMRVFDFLASKRVALGLYPIRINHNTGEFTTAQAS